MHAHLQPTRPRWFALLVGLPLAWGAVTAEAQSTVPPLRPSMPEPANPVYDAAISANVNAALAHDPPLAKVLIDVETVNGQVALKGAAPSSELRERATRVAASVAGVVSVENRLSLERPAPIAPR
jgi:hypothetical protein